VLDTIASVGWPVLDRFRFGDTLAISPHGLGIAIGFMVGAWLLTKLAVRRGMPESLANSIVFWSVVGSLVGARVAYVIGHVSEFSGPSDWFKIWEGGISLLGGIAGATIANAVNIKRQEYRFRFFQVADTIAPCLALGISVGRIGDLIIGDHLGKPTSWLLAWTYEGGTLAPPFSCGGDSCTARLRGGLVETIDTSGAVLRDGPEVIARGIGIHQTALYDMLLAGLLFAFLWWLIGSPRREGVATLTFALAYGCIRLLEDSLRIDKRFGPFTGSQWTALVVAIIASGLLIYWAVSKRPGPTTPGRREPIRADADADAAVGS
jgi:phosphatidylglycerol---prolipoprotein diacylglyceryl transferase